jgi:hypothetical protein
LLPPRLWRLLLPKLLAPFRSPQALPLVPWERATQLILLLPETTAEWPEKPWLVLLKNFWEACLFMVRVLRGELAIT